MQLNELVKEVLKKEGMSQKDVAEKLNTSPGNICQILGKASMHGDTAVEILDLMGYKLVAVKTEETIVG